MIFTSRGNLKWPGWGRKSRSISLLLLNCFSEKKNKKLVIMCPKSTRFSLGIGPRKSLQNKGCNFEESLQFKLSILTISSVLRLLLAGAKWRNGFSNHYHPSDFPYKSWPEEKLLLSHCQHLNLSI